MKKIYLLLCLLLMSGVGAFSQEPSPSPAVTAPAKKPAVFRPTKDQIKQVQTMLTEKKLYTGDASGTYNDPTRAAIKSFQKDNGLKDTGTLNRATLEKFGVELTDGQKLIPVLDSSFAANDKPKPATKAGSGPSASTDAKPKKPAPFRATADQIKAAQKMMKEKSMYAGTETGKLDDATREGLKKFQDGSGLKVTGTLNAVTLEKMGIALTDKQKADAAAIAPTNK